MFTSNYKNFNGNDYREISISEDGGKSADYQGKVYLDLAPKKELLQAWKNNIDKMSFDENVCYFIEQYYKTVLSKLDPEVVYSDLKYKILLSDEESVEFSHRHIVAEWIKLLFNEEVPEIKSENNNYIKVNRPTNIALILEKTIKNNSNMKGFSSLQALRLFEQSEKMEFMASKCEVYDAEYYCVLMTLAEKLKREASNVELEYRNLTNDQNEKSLRRYK